MILERLIEILKAAEKSAQGNDQLVLTKKAQPTGERMFLVGPGSPLGEILCCPSDAETTLLFRATDVLAWCVVQLKEYGVHVEIQKTGSKVDSDQDS